MVHVQELRPRVLLATELTRLVPAGEDILAEHLPLRGSAELFVLPLYHFKVIFTSHTSIIANCVVLCLYNLLLFTANSTKGVL